MNEDRWLSAAEIAAYLGVKPNTVYQWITRKNLPAHKVGRFWKFRKAEVDRWIGERERLEKSQVRDKKSAAERRNRLIALSDHLKKSPGDKAALREVVVFLADPESTLRWQAGSTLKILSSREVVTALAEFLSRKPAEKAQWEALKILGLIAGTSKDPGVQQAARLVMNRQ